MTSPTVPEIPLLPLDSSVCRDPRWCYDCARLETFVFVFATEAGRCGFCFGCGGEKFVPFSRTTGEGA